MTKSKSISALSTQFTNHGKPKPVVQAHEIYRSGSVERWHSYPEIPAQTIADHQCRVAQIICFFFWGEASSHLLYAALHHDCAELWTGDVPFFAKYANPELRKTLEATEHQAREKMGIRNVSFDSPYLQFADRLEAYTYVALRCPDLLGRSEWVIALRKLGEMADALGVSDKLVDWFNHTRC